MQEKLNVPQQPTRHDAIENFGIEKLTNFTNALGIKWKIIVTHKEGVFGAAIYSHPLEKTHEILLPKKVGYSAVDNLPDIAHELCHARFSEELDLIYSTMRFPKYYGDLDPTSKEYKDFITKAHMIEASQAWVDIWINELRHNLWPELTAQDNETVLSSLEQLCKQGRLSHVLDDKMMVMVAIILAEQEKYGDKKYDMKFLTQALGPSWQKVKKLARIFEGISHFTDGKNGFTEEAKTHGLWEFEKTVRKVAKEFGYPINPTIKKETIPSGESVNVWDFQ